MPLDVDANRQLFRSAISAIQDYMEDQPQDRVGISVLVGFAKGIANDVTFYAADGREASDKGKGSGEVRELGGSVGRTVIDEPTGQALGAGPH